MSLIGYTLADRFLFTSQIGKGAYGIVYKVSDAVTQNTFAVKVIPRKKALASNRDLGSLTASLLGSSDPQAPPKSFIHGNNIQANLVSAETIMAYASSSNIVKEIALHLKVHDHPNIVTIHGVFDCPLGLFVIMDYYGDGDLFGAITQDHIYAEDPLLIKSVYCQLLDAVEYCHTRGVFHCDIKPENVLVADRGARVALADFGLAMSEPVVSSNVCCGSSYYMAPERLINIEKKAAQNAANAANTSTVMYPTAAGDVWSLGVILVNLTCTRNPWMKAVFADDTYREYVRNPALLQKILPISQELNDILNTCFVRSPFKRTSIAVLRERVLRCSSFTTGGPLSDAKPIYSNRAPDPPENNDDNRQHQPNNRESEGEDEDESEDLSEESDGTFYGSDSTTGHTCNHGAAGDYAVPARRNLNFNAYIEQEAVSNRYSKCSSCVSVASSLTVEEAAARQINVNVGNF